MDKQAILICVDGLGGHYLEDPKVKIPNIRSLIEKGSYVSRLKTTYPSVTWSANTSAITGCYPNRHGVIGNSVLDNIVGSVSHHWGDQLGNKEELIHVSTLYDQVASYGGSTASICWPLTRGATNITYNIPEHYDQSLFEAFSSPEFWSELKDELPIDRYAEWSSDFSKGHMQDWLTKDIVQYVIQNKSTNLIMVHFLLIDSLLHKYGNQSAEVYWAIEYIDQLIGDLITCLQKEEQLDTTDILIYSDHGHLDVNTNFYPNRFLSGHGLDTDYQAVSNDGCIFIYAKENTQEHEKVVALFEALSFVKCVLPKSSFDDLGLPVTHLDERKHTPEYIIELEDGYMSKDSTDEGQILSASTYQSTHGYNPDHPMMQGFMVGSGPSFLEGALLKDAHIIDIAPTLSQALGVELPSPDGKILHQLLNPHVLQNGGTKVGKL